MLNDTIFNNNRIILNDIYFQRSNLFEIIDKIDYLTNEKKTNEKNKICEEKNITQNPVLEYVRNIILPSVGYFELKRPGNPEGNV